MFGIYLRRELLNRRRQTIIIAIGMALAIALVIVVNAASAGVQRAQATALSSIYGVGTDITVTKTPTAPNGAGRQDFAFGAGDGRGGSRSVASARLTASPATPTFTSDVVSTVAATNGVRAATGVLQLRNVSFTGTLPNAGSGGFGRRSSQPTGGADGRGGSAFSVDSFTVLGYDPAKADLGPVSSTKLVSGRSLTTADDGKDVAVLDSAYATGASLKVGSTIKLGSTSFDVVGLVASTATSGSSASNVYVPLSTAQSVASLKNDVTGVYVTATSADAITGADAALTKALGSGYTVNTEASLADDVSGSLSTASTLADSLGLWLSVAVLAAAFLIAILFTVSGVTRRTREFGTLKAIGWSDRRIVGQVAGESFVQGLIGAVIGVVVGLAAILVVNAIHPTLTASAARAGGGFRAGGFSGGGGAGGFGGGFGGEGAGFGAARAARAASDIVLSLPITANVILIAVGLAVLGGLLAGAFGGWRASRLRPAAALRSVA